VAVIYQDRTITYRDFGRASNGLAALLESRGLKPGPIVIMMPNSIEMDVALMAVMSTGAQVAPVNPFLTVAEVGKVLDGFGATAIVCDPSTQNKANAVAEKIGVTRSGILIIRNVAMCFDAYLAQMMKEKPVFSKTV